MTFFEPILIRFFILIEFLFLIFLIDKLQKNFDKHNYY